jgi:hypothetical protein
MVAMTAAAELAARYHAQREDRAPPARPVTVVPDPEPEPPAPDTGITVIFWCDLPPDIKPFAAVGFGLTPDGPVVALRTIEDGHYTEIWGLPGQLREVAAAIVGACQTGDRIGGADRGEAAQRYAG